MGKLKFKISEELFVDAFNMPVGTKIQWISKEVGAYLPTVVVIAVHDDIPEAKVGQLNFTDPIITVVKYCKECAQPTQMEWDWNVEDTEEEE